MSADTNRSGDECEKLLRRHADIAMHGAGVLQLLQEKEALSQRRRDYAIAHNISCFKCGTRLNEWARCGKTNGRYWAICVRCVRTPRRA